MWRASLAAIFLGLAVTWIYYAFLWPPVFSRKNYRRYYHNLYRLVVRGLDEELAIIAVEIGLSAKALVRYSREDRPAYQASPETIQHNNSGNLSSLLKSVWVRFRVAGRTKSIDSSSRMPATVQNVAFDVLLLLGNKKLCRYIAKSSVTAIAVFEEASSSMKYHLPLGPFARNVSGAAITDKDSILYHEDEGFSSGLTGYLKSFSNAIYGDYDLVEGLGARMGSPLDVDYLELSEWDAKQLEGYSRAVLITLKGYLDSQKWGQHSFALHRALGGFESATSDLYQLSSAGSDYFYDDRTQRLRVVVKFISKAIEVIDDVKPPPRTVLRPNAQGIHRDMYDNLADLALKMIESTSGVKLPPDSSWMLHHNLVWSEFFGVGRSDSCAAKIVKSKLRRLLFDEIQKLDDMPNFLGARLLGYCLYVMGLAVRDRNYERDYLALHRVLLAWAKRNYRRLYDTYPEVAEACLVGSLSFEVRENRLVKTYAKFLSREVPREYLELDPPTAPAAVN